ncbi:MAG: uncharacterized protein JWM27_5073 [Gemmatimonadetes bacterium]|nr:uncharacterized protein [Gemmatimonadota bacterium]
MRKLIAAAFLLACTAGAARAQTPVQPRPSASPAAHTADPARLAAAHELVDALNVQKVLDESMNTMLRAQMQTNPQLAQFEDVMREFFGKYFTWAALRDGYAQIYADQFTEPELRQISAFYHSPVGRRLADATPQIMQAGSDLGRDAVQAHLPELQQMIMARMQAPAAPPAKP